MKFTKTFKIATTIHNVTGKCEKYLVMTAFIMTGIKLLSAVIMDHSQTKTY